MAKTLSIIIPVYKESKESLDSLWEWILDETRENSEWLIALSNDDKSIALFEQSKFWQNTNSDLNLLESHLDKRRSPASTNELIPLANRKNINLVLSAKGRSKQMNKGAQLSSGEILIFLHSDTRLDNSWHNELNKANSISWGCFKPRVDDEGLLFRLAENWGFWRTKLFGYPFGDQCIFVLKDLFQRAGGFDEDVQFMEELELSKTLKSKWGKPAIMCSRARTSSRLWRTEKHRSFLPQLMQSTKNLIAFICFLGGMPRQKIQSWYQIQF